MRLEVDKYQRCENSISCISSEQRIFRTDKIKNDFLLEKTSMHRKAVAAMRELKLNTLITQTCGIECVGLGRLLFI